MFSTLLSRNIARVCNGLSWSGAEKFNRSLAKWESHYGNIFGACNLQKWNFLAERKIVSQKLQKEKEIRQQII